VFRIYDFNIYIVCKKFYHLQKNCCCFISFIFYNHHFIKTCIRTKG